MRSFVRHVFAEPNESGKERPPPCTWSTFDLGLIPEDHRRHYAKYLAFATCANGHCCMISREVHSIASDGTLSPSYVCPVTGCGFHEFVRFDGWTP